MARAPKKIPGSRSSGRPAPKARAAASAKKTAAPAKKASRAAARASGSSARAKPAGRKTSARAAVAKKTTAKPKRPAAKTPAKRAVVRATPKATSKTAAKQAAKPAKPAAKQPAKPARPAAKQAKAPAKASARPTSAPPPAPAPKPAAVKAPVKAEPPKPEPPKKPRKPEVTPREIAGIKAALEEQRTTLVREFADIEEGAFNLTQSEMSGEVSFDEEYADAGSFTFEREKELSIGNNIRDLLDKVEHALVAIERGTYGICESCGDPISKARLLALPYSTLCLRCKQQEERTR